MDRVIEHFIKDGTQYYKLYCKCPNCVKKGVNIPPSFWYCESCGGEIYVGDNAHLNCKECGRERHVMLSEFKCPDCRMVNEEVVDLNKVHREFFDHNIHAEGEIATRGTGISWLTHFLKNMETID